MKLLIDYFFSCICTLIPRTLPLNTLWTWKWSSANPRKGPQRTSNYYYPMRKQHCHSDKCHVTLSVVREPYVALKCTYLKPRARSIRGDGKLFPPPPSSPPPPKKNSLLLAFFARFFQCCYGNGST